MATVKPFKAIRPAMDKASAVAALPYDVMNTAEARETAMGNPDSFLHVDKAEIDLPDSVSPYDDTVYEKARENYLKLLSNATLIRDDTPGYYIYRLTMNGRSQTGIVGCPAVDDYLENRIKKHELTRADKEADRIRHVDTLNANTGPIFLAHRPSSALSKLVEDWIAAHAAVYDFTSDGSVRNEAWIVDDPQIVSDIETAFAGIDVLYIADGHHRCASAVRVCEKRRAAKPEYTGDEEFNYFLAVIFPSDQLKIFDYNRLIRDLNGLTEETFLKKVAGRFDIIPAKTPVSPQRAHTFGMYLNGKWYHLSYKFSSCERDTDEADRDEAAASNPSVLNASTNPVSKLDVSILQRELLQPILGIEDPRTDKRIDFVGGIRGLKELERRVDTDMKVAFSMYPTTIDELMDIADADRIMPPKSTWFEPKLLSGLFIHELD
ncbi:MAG: DUF1015 family protein [Clostridiales Family XIII bacterium]|jgi:uncharacterized protein (DUF1015 family)|nr:DUF1015 family protein [Clostridiales Family XIII bacterium]